MFSLHYTRENARAQTAKFIPLQGIAILKQFFG
jgi:hypothetical protein